MLISSVCGDSLQLRSGNVSVVYVTRLLNLI